MKLLALFILSTSLYANTIYLAPEIAPAYMSGDKGLSSLMGTGFNLNLGIGLNDFMATEAGVGIYNFSSQSIGDRDYNTKVKVSKLSGGMRFFIGDFFSAIAGGVFHNFSMDIKKDGVTQDDEEFNSSAFSIFGGMGVRIKDDGMDYYIESRLYPVPSADLYFIDMAAGIRLHY